MSEARKPHSSRIGEALILIDRVGFGAYNERFTEADRHKLRDDYESLLEQLEATRLALESVGDYAFGTWEFEEEREEAGRIAEGLARAALDTNTASEPTPLQRAYGGKVRKVSTDASSPASVPKYPAFENREELPKVWGVPIDGPDPAKRRDDG